MAVPFSDRSLPSTCINTEIYLKIERKRKRFFICFFSDIIHNSVFVECLFFKEYEIDEVFEVWVVKCKEKMEIVFYEIVCKSTVIIIIISIITFFCYFRKNDIGSEHVSIVKEYKQKILNQLKTS